MTQEDNLIAAEARAHRFDKANKEWVSKTDWMTQDPRFNGVSNLGKHRADILHEYAESSKTMFVVFFIDFNNEERYSGVFSSKEKAEAYISKFSEPKSCFSIEAVDIDSE